MEASFSLHQVRIPHQQHPALRLRLLSEDKSRLHLIPIPHQPILPSPADPHSGTSQGVFTRTISPRWVSSAYPASLSSAS